MRRAIFIDRDGVICRNRDDYVKSWEEFVFLPGARKALARLSQSNLFIVIITNQSIINRNIVPEKIVRDMHNRMVRAIEVAGGRVDRVLYCPHRPDEACDCRKPRPGMLMEAAQDLRLDLSRSFLVGDAKSDLEAGQAVGCERYLVLTGRGRSQLPRCWLDGELGFTLARNLGGAANMILQKEIRARHQVPRFVRGEGWIR